MTTTSKDEFEGYFNFKTSRYNFMYTFLYTNISEFCGNWEGMMDEGMYKKTLKNAQDLLEG